MTPYQNPTIWLGNLRIDEPITTLTDFVFAAICIFAFLNTKQNAQTKGILLYRYFFLFTGISTLISAVMGHAFLYHFEMTGKFVAWQTNALAVSLASFAAIYHTQLCFSKSVFKYLVIFNIIETIAALVLTALFFSFVVVEIHSAYCLLCMVTVVESIYFKKTKSILSYYFLIGVGVAVIAVLVHILKLAISVWFNHLDLSHIIMSIGVYLMYLGVKKEISNSANS